MTKYDIARLDHKGRWLVLGVCMRKGRADGWMVGGGTDMERFSVPVTFQSGGQQFHSDTGELSEISYNRDELKLTFCGKAHGKKQSVQQKQLKKLIHGTVIPSM